jgi:hypothetical protein
MSAAPDSNHYDRLHRLRDAAACRATTATRVQLIAHNLGISDAELDGFYFKRKSNAKHRHFDDEAFSKAYGVSVHWLWHGMLSQYPKGLSRPPQRPPQRRQQQQVDAQPRKRKDRREGDLINRAIRDRIKDISVFKGLKSADIKPALTLNHLELFKFTQKHSLSLEWLISGTGKQDQAVSS